MKKKSNYLFLIAVLLILIEIKTDCLDSSTLKPLGFTEIDIPKKLESKYCHKIWETENFCLSSDNYFKLATEKFFETSNTLRKINFKKITDNFDDLLSKISESKETILDSESNMLYPLNAEVFKYKFEKTYPSCYTAINGNFNNILCKLVSGSASNYLIENKKIKLNQEYNYAMLKNCLSIFRAYCLYFKYFSFKMKEENKEDIFLNLINKNIIETCDSNLVICSNDYSNVECNDEVRNKLFINFLDSKGINGEEYIFGLIEYFFEGKSFPEKKEDNLDFFIDQEGEGIELFLNYNDLKYQYENGAILMQIMLINAFFYFFN